MGNFTRSGKEPDLVSLYKSAGGVTVFLESEDDLAIFGSKWFLSLKDRINFESVDSPRQGGGGCQKVLARVAEARNAGMDAYGGRQQIIYTLATNYLVTDGRAPVLAVFHSLNCATRPHRPGIRDNRPSAGKRKA